MRFWHISPVADLHRRHRRADLEVARNVVGAGRFLDEEGVGEGQCLHPLDRLADFPDLVGVDHEVTVGADHLAGDGEPAYVILDIAPDLHLHMVEAGIDRLAAQPAQLIVVIAEPAGRGGVAGIALALEDGDALRLAGLGLPKDGERLATIEDVGEVAIVDDVGDLLRRHVGDQTPDRLAGLPWRAGPRPH